MRFSKSFDFATRLICLSNIKCIFHFCISHHTYSSVPNTLSTGLKPSGEGDWIWFSWERTVSEVLKNVYKRWGRRGGGVRGGQLFGAKERVSSRMLCNIMTEILVFFWMGASWNLPSLVLYTHPQATEAQTAGGVL